MKGYNLPDQIGFDGATQEERVYKSAIERTRLAYASAGGKPLYVAFSGGKDSTALWGIVCEAAALDGVPVEQYAVRHYNVTGIDPPELVYHMREHCPDLVWDMYNTSFWRLIVKKGPPTRLKRWCCAELKERGGRGYMRLTGVRWAESLKRQGRAAFEKITAKKADKILLNDNDDARRYFEHCIPKARTVCNPILDWTDDNVWRYIQERRLPYCKLYDEGFRRLGCIGCPMAGEGRFDQFKRWPAFEGLYIRAFDRMLEARVSKGLPTTVWESGRDVFDWWMGDGNLDKPLPGQIEWEDYDE